MKKLPPHTKYYFDQFAIIGAAWNWHSNDVERFRAFIHAAHQGRVKLYDWELKELLIAQGFYEEDASKLAERYQFGRDLLKLKPAFGYMGPNRIKR